MKFQGPQQQPHGNFGDSGIASWRPPGYSGGLGGSNAGTAWHGAMDQSQTPGLPQSQPGMMMPPPPNAGFQMNMPQQSQPPQTQSPMTMMAAPMMDRNSNLASGLMQQPQMGQPSQTANPPQQWQSPGILNLPNQTTSGADPKIMGQMLMGRQRF